MSVIAFVLRSGLGLGTTAIFSNDAEVPDESMIEIETDAVGSRLHALEKWGAWFIAPRHQDPIFLSHMKTEKQRSRIFSAIANEDLWP